LRAELRAVTEVRLMSDDDFRNLRANERAAQERLVEQASARMRAAHATMAAIRNAADPGEDLAALRDAVNRDASAFRQAVSNTPQEREKIAYDNNLRLHQTLRRTAVQAGLLLPSWPPQPLAPSTAGQVAKLSKDLRDQGFVSSPGSPAARGSMEEFQAWCDQQRLQNRSGTVPTLTQMLQIEDEAKRLPMVRELTRIRSAAATTQLAVRAIVDLSPAVRQAAVAGLEQRPWQQYAPVLLGGLRYPWPPVADHAAAALRALSPSEAVAPLVDLLDLPSPSAPVLDAETNRYTVRELVRLNHLRNCLLCHAPSASKEDGLVRALVPTPGEALPVVYYEGQGGSFVKADMTFLRQDFSVLLPVEEAGPWPHEQRYDFVTRLRTLPPGKGTALPASGKYPQRDAVLYALRGLTGKDGGDSSARWRELLGPIAGKPGGEKERPALANIAVSLTEPDRPR
jgi:hypothetical protein